MNLRRREILILPVWKVYVYVLCIYTCVHIYISSKSTPCANLDHVMSGHITHHVPCHVIPCHVRLCPVHLIPCQLRTSSVPCYTRVTGVVLWVWFVVILSLYYLQHRSLNRSKHRLALPKPSFKHFPTVDRKNIASTNPTGSLLHAAGAVDSN